MKRILYSCFIILSLCFSQVAKAQPPSYSITTNPQCANPSGVYTSTAAIVVVVPGATSYSWQVITATSPCAQTVTPISTGTLANPSITNDAIAITLACCGNYTITCSGWLGATFIGSANIAPFQSGNQNSGVIYCANGASITPANQSICLGAATTITANAPGVVSYTWSDGQVTANPTIAVSPSINTCYTFTGTTAQGCTVTAGSAGCVSVQAITAAASPVSQSMCVGSLVSFTGVATVVSNGSVTPGTAITGYQWLEPPNNALAAGATATALAQAGNYTVVVTHTGSAGTCTTSALSSVVITTNIPVSITPSSFSICPSGCLTLTAVSIQTASSSYSWTQSAGTPSNFTGNPAVRCAPGVATLPRTYTVNVDYYGCPGQATVTIGLLVLTPTLTPSAISSCPGRSLALSSSTTPGTSYTFQAFPSSGGTPTMYIPKGATTTPSVAHTPSGVAVFPMQYCLLTASAGCTGSTCITVNSRTLTPTLTASSPSVCPGTQFTLTASGSGVQTGTTYTFHRIIAVI